MKKKLKTPLEVGVPLNPNKGLASPAAEDDQLSNGNGANTNGNSNPIPSPKNLEPEDVLNARELLKVLAEVKSGNFKVRMPVDKIGVTGKICDTLNDIISLNQILVEQLTLARNTIGKQGQLNHRVELPKSAMGSWNAASDSINSLISDLVHPTIE